MLLRRHWARRVWSTGNPRRGTVDSWTRRPCDGDSARGSTRHAPRSASRAADPSGAYANLQKNSFVGRKSDTRVDPARDQLGTTVQRGGSGPMEKCSCRTFSSCRFRARAAAVSRLFERMASSPRSTGTAGSAFPRRLRTAMDQERAIMDESAR